MTQPCYSGSRQQPTPSPRYHHSCLPSMWNQSLRETLSTDRIWVYLLYFNLWCTGLLLLQPAAIGTQTKLSVEHAHCLFIVVGVASWDKHVDEWRHGKSSGFVKCVKPAVMSAAFEVKPCILWRLNIQEIEWRCRYAMISSLNGGSPYESKYSAYPKSVKQTATQCEPGI